MAGRDSRRALRSAAGLPVLAAASLLGACATDVPTTSALPSIYLPLATDNAHLDVEAARDMISAYRRNRGAAPLTVDPELQRLAEAEAASMALADRPSKAQTVKSAVGRLGFSEVNANLSAGYHTWPRPSPAGARARRTKRRCSTRRPPAWASPPPTRRARSTGCIGRC